MKRSAVLVVVNWAIAAQAFAVSAELASVAAPALHVGDTWVYDRTFEKATSSFIRRRVVLRIDGIRSDTMLIGIKPDGAPVDFEDHLGGLDWSQRRLVDGQQTVTGRPFSFPMAPGKTWTADYVDPRPHGAQQWARFRST